MRFHAYLPTYWDDYGSTAMEAAITTAASAAAELGYEGLWANDKLVIRPGERGKVVAEQLLEPLVMLASLVHIAPGLTLGTAVVVLPVRDPILLAKRATALHVMSGGRFVLGVGIGHRADEFDALGVSFAKRAAAADEAIELLQSLWRDPAVSFQGRFHQLDDVAQEPRPPDGGPPIWIGGMARGAVERAARIGSGWLAFVNDGDPLRSGSGGLPVGGRATARAGPGQGAPVRCEHVLRPPPAIQ